MQYLSKSVYPLYMVHQTVIVRLAYVLVQGSLPVAAKFSVLLLLGFAVTVGLSGLIMAWRPARVALGVSSGVTSRSRPVR